MHGVRRTQLRVQLRRIVVKAGIERVEQQLPFGGGTLTVFADRLGERRGTEQAAGDAAVVSARAGLRHLFLLAAFGSAVTAVSCLRLGRVPQRPLPEAIGARSVAPIVAGREPVRLRISVRVRVCRESMSLQGDRLDRRRT